MIVEIPFDERKRDKKTEDCTEADIRITLSWDELGQDWEHHLIKPSGRINDDATDCTWTSCLGESPDWGVEGDSSDDSKKNVDNTSAFGPENIVLSNPEAGTYSNTGAQRIRLLMERCSSLLPTIC